MSPERRDVQEEYLRLYYYVVSVDWRVSPDDKEILDGYWVRFFEMTDKMNACLHDPKNFQSHVKSAIAGLEQIQKDIKGGIIQNAEVAKELGDCLQRALDIGKKFLDSNGQP